MCSQNIHLKFFVTELSTKQFSDNSVSLSCMHDTNGHNHLEAGETAAYDGYNLVGHSVDPPHAAKIQKTKPVQGDTFLDGHHYM